MAKTLQEKCLVCIRINVKHIAKYAHKIFNENKDKETIHKIIEEACNAINYADKTNRIALCGKTERVILSGLFYLLSFRYAHYYQDCMTQSQIARSFEIYGHPVGVRKGYRLWLKHFPELFKDVMEKQLFADITERRGINFCRGIERMEKTSSP